MKPINKLNSTMALAALAVAASLSWATTASASSPVTVLNPGFELPVVATDGAFSPATSWSIIGGAVAGVWNPTAANYTAQAPEGSNVGYVYGAADTGLSQVLSDNFQESANYTLTVKVGYSNAYAFDGYKVQLLAGGVVLTGAEDDNSNPPAVDTFSTSTINYTYNVADAAKVGQPLEIRLLSKGFADGQTDFDNVQLTATFGNPVAKAGGPYSVAYTGSLSLNGSTSLPSEGQTITTYEWDLNNDGNYEEMITGATPASITYATLQSTYGMAIGANTIHLRVTDDSSPTPKTNVTTGTVNLAVGPPANDNFANAIDLTGAGAGQTGNATTGTQTGTYSTSASLEVGEPSPGEPASNNSVWFKWTSPGDGAFTYYTNGSTNAAATEWDSIIGIYTGATVNALTPLGTTPKDTGAAETMTVTVTPGTTYYIQLTGWRGEAAANILLNWNYVATVYQAEILTYGPGAVIGPVVDNAANIAWTVPFDSDLSTLAPTFTLFVGATATLDGNPAVSGATVDFSGGPKNYVVTSQGGAFVNTYTVTATLAPPPTDGTWITDGNGNWSDPANWQDGTVADGRHKTAFFTKNITGTTARVVTVNAARTIGNITFTDSTTSSTDLTISGANILTLDVNTGKPVIDVTQSGNRQLTISSVIAGNDGLQKNGLGILNLGATNTYTGGTVVNDGILNFGATNIDGIGGGPGSRDISVAANKIVQRAGNNLDAAFMKRLVETSDEFAVCLNASGASDVGTGKTVDFSSSTNGANLPNAFLASFATNGGQCRYNGTIVPASDNYRIGYPGTNGALSIIQPLVDVGTPRGLIIGGATPVLVADNTFTGDTVLRAGRLFLGRQLALQNSALNVGNGVDGNTGQICFLASNVSGATQGQLTDQPTLGGLIGSRNLATIYVSTNQNNTTRLAITSVLGLTLDVDTGKTHTYAGNVRLATGMYLTKTGLGTQILSGANDYTGATSVNEGTFQLVGGSHKSPITVATGASLGFTLGSPTTSTAALDMTNGTVKITGTVDNASDYKLMTASSINVTPALDSPITDYELQRLAGNTELWLVHVGGSSYADWQTANTTAQTIDLDHDSDGVSNGVEYFLGGAANTTGFTTLPGIVNTAGTLSITWPKGAGYVGVYGTDYVVETSTSLSGVWTTETLGGGNITDSGIDVKYTFPAPLGDKNFARLKVSGP